MIRFLFLHLLECTFLCLLLSAVACCLRKGATARHAVLLLGLAKFAVPTILLAKTGERIASFWPASSWLFLLTYKFTVVLAFLEGALPVAWRAEFLAVWAVGLVGLAAAWGVRLRNSKCDLTMPGRGEAMAFERCRGLLRVRNNVRFRCSRELIEPALRGLWHPTITISTGLSEKLSQAEFESVLLHELAHAKRFDNLTSVLAHALVCVFWFHPLVWFVERRLAVERERACDETVLACGTAPNVYATGILKVCRFQMFDAAGVNAMTGGDLQRRLQSILDGQVPVNLLYVPWILVVGLAIFMTLVPVAGGYCEQCAFGGNRSSEGAAAKCKTPAACPQVTQ